MALHLEDGGLAVADVDHAGVLARALDHPRRLGRQLLQPAPWRTCRSSARSTSPRRCRARPGSASRPRIASMRSYSSGARPCSATICGVIAGSLGSLTGGFFSTALGRTAHVSASTSPSNSALPSLPPSSGSTRVLRVRHQPQHVLVSLKTPAMFADRAVGIAGAVDRAVGRAVAERDLAAPRAASACPRRRSSCRRAWATGTRITWPAW